VLVLKIGKLVLEKELADDPLKRVRGLMFRRRLDKALLFVLPEETKMGAAIHSYFVFFPFDIIWLNRDKKIVDMRTVRPFRLFEAPGKRAKYFIELPAGSIKKAKIKIGDKINLN